MKGLDPVGGGARPLRSIKLSSETRKKRLAHNVDEGNVRNQAVIEFAPLSSDNITKYVGRTRHTMKDPITYHT